MKLQYASDLHIDTWPQGTNFCNFLTPSAPFLALAGDICSAWDHRFEEFLAWCSRLWYTTFIVPGNHEYHNPYGRTMSQTDNYIYNICLKFKNIIFLQGDASYKIPGTNVRIFGTTLWSNIDYFMWEKAKDKSDYKNIYVDEGRLVTPRDITLLHFQQTHILWDVLTHNYTLEKLIVITHHMPSKALLEPEYRGEAWHSFYASDTDFLFNPNIKLWICGHSHRATQLQVPHGPLLAMNARGYNRTHELTRTSDIYNPSATVIV